MKKSHRGYCNVVESSGKLRCLDCLYYEPERNTFTAGVLRRKAVKKMRIL